MPLKPKRAFFDAYAPDKLAKAFDLTAMEAHLLSVLFRWVDYESPHKWTGSKTDLAERGLRATRRATAKALEGLAGRGLIHHEEHKNQSITVRLLCWDAINAKVANQNTDELTEWLAAGNELPPRRRANQRDAVEPGSAGSPSFTGSESSTSPPSTSYLSALVPTGSEDEQVRAGDVAPISATTARRERDAGATTTRRVAPISATDEGFEGYSGEPFR